MCAVKIEKSASLNVLLHRLFLIKAILAENDKVVATYFSLKQNPQFYSKFPNVTTDFYSPSSFPVSKTKLYIPALHVWDLVERYEGKPLHVIVDRESNREVILGNFSRARLPEIYSNGWHLDGSNTEIAVREKGM